MTLSSLRTALAGICLVAAVGAMAWVVGPSGPGHEGEGETVAGLVGRLRGGATPGRREAATALGRVVGPGARSAASALVAALGDRDAEVRARSARSLGTLPALNPGTPLVDLAATALSACLGGDRDPDVRDSAVAGLRALGREGAGPLAAILDGLRDRDPGLRAGAVAAISALPVRDEPILRRLLSLLDDPARDVREAARTALDRAGSGLAPEAALPALGSALGSGTPGTRAIAAALLGRSAGGSRAARDLLLGVLAKDRDPDVRDAAAAGLARVSADPTSRPRGGVLAELDRAACGLIEALAGLSPPIEAGARDVPLVDPALDPSSPGLLLRPTPSAVAGGRGPAGIEGDAGPIATLRGLDRPARVR